MKTLFSISALIVTFMLPLAVIAQTQEFSGKADLDILNKQIQDSNLEYCHDTTWFAGLKLNNQQSRNYFNRYTIPFALHRVSLTLPHRTDWSLQGKSLQTYLVLDRNEIGVGSVELIQTGVQESVCEMGRKYRVKLERGTVTRKASAHSTGFKTVSKDATMEGELPTIWMTLGGKRAAIIPSYAANSGTYFMFYNRILVDLPNGYVLTVEDPATPHISNVNTDMLRIAASARFP